MTGIYNDNNPGATHQPPHVLAAWIQEQLGEVRDTHLRRIAALRAELQARAFEWDASTLAPAVSTLSAAGRELKFEQLRRSWIARWLAKPQEAYAPFMAAYDRFTNCAANLKKALSGLAAGYKTHASGTKRVIVELDIEC